MKEIDKPADKGRHHLYDELGTQRSMKQNGEIGNQLSHLLQQIGEL